MPASRDYTSEIALFTQQALNQMPIRSSALARRMLNDNLPEPETSEDIERYVHDLLSHKPRAGAMG